MFYFAALSAEKVAKRNKTFKNQVVMKRFTFFVLSVLSCTVFAAAQTKTVNVERPGTLCDLLTEEELSTVKELTVTGTVNYEDMPIIRAMCGYDGDGNATGVCEKLDLSGATVITLDDYGSDLVDAIGINELANCAALKTLVLPDNLKEYQSRGLAYNSNLTEIIISEDNPNFTAEGCALYNKDKSVLCVLSAAAEGTFVIPSNLTDAYPSAFLGCDKITAYEVEEGNTVFSSAGGALVKGDELYLVPGGVTGFLNIPEGVTSISTNAFSGSQVEGVGIPSTLTEVGQSDFSGAENLVRFTVADANPHYLVVDESFLVNKDDPRILLLGAPGLSGEVTLPEGITGVNNYACSQCSKIERLIAPEGVTDIYDFAFGSCTGLTYLSLPSTLKMLTHQCFINCRNLLDVYIYATEVPQSNGSVSFYGGADGCTLWVPEGTLEAYKADKGCGFMWFALQTGNSIKEMTPSSIGSVDAGLGTVEETARYTLDGRRIEKPVRGVNIVRFSDGSTRKELVK